MEGSQGGCREAVSSFRQAKDDGGLDQDGSRAGGEKGVEGRDI